MHQTRRSDTPATTIEEMALNDVENKIGTDIKIAKKRNVTPNSKVSQSRRNLLKERRTNIKGIAEYTEQYKHIRKTLEKTLYSITTNPKQL